MEITTIIITSLRRIAAMTSAGGDYSLAQKPWWRAGGASVGEGEERRKGVGGRGGEGKRRERGKTMINTSFWFVCATALPSSSSFQFLPPLLDLYQNNYSFPSFLPSSLFPSSFSCSLFLPSLPTHSLTPILGYYIPFNPFFPPFPPYFSLFNSSSTRILICSAFYFLLKFSPLSFPLVFVHVNPISLFCSSLFLLSFSLISPVAFSFLPS